MRYIEASRMITLANPAESYAVRQWLVERLRGPFHLETVGEGVENFRIDMTGKFISCRCLLDVILKTDGQRARIAISGVATISASAKIAYSLGIMALLVLGLFPGTINTTGKGTAIDFLVFLFIGIFILYDIGKKLAEPEAILDRILGSVAAEFGA